MKTIKPQRLGILHRTYENERQCYFVPSILVFFAFEAPDVPLHEANMWKVVAAELGEQTALDECMWKTRGEVLVTGNAYPSGGAHGACAVRLKLGDIDKELYVVGDRQWLSTGPSDPVPFREMPIRWTHAYGGEGYQDNPVGKGRAPIVDEKSGIKHHPLPNVEHPKQLLTSPSDHPEPAGFGPLDLTWGARAKRRGSYDDKWFQERYPGFPADLDWTFFNVAPHDQWLAGHFEGGEPFELSHMHPEQSTQVSRLPRLAPRCFITRQDATELEEISLRLDTVHLFPHLGRGVCFYRGVTPVKEDDASDITVLMLACEKPGEPRPMSHYNKVLQQRLDHKKAYLYILRDSDLIHQRDPQAPPIDHENLPENEHGLLDFPLAANMRRRAERKLEQAREKIIALGFDPDEMGVPAELPPPEKEPSLDDLAEYVEEKLTLAEEQRLAAEKKKDEIIAKARASCEKLGVDYDQQLAAMQAKQGGPPSFRAAEELERLRARAELANNAGVPLPQVTAKLSDPDLVANLQKAEDGLLLAYRRYAHLFPAAAQLDDENSRRIRTLVQTKVSAGQSLAGVDLTGADLSELDLSGADLSGAFLEATNLRGTKFDGANLTDAVLVRADITEASFVGASVLRTNFGDAKLHRTNLSGGLDLSGAVFGKAELYGTKLTGACLTGADLMDSKLKDCDLSGVTGDQLLFYETDLSSVNLSGATLTSCLFYQCNAKAAKFDGATLDESSMVTTDASGASFVGTQAINLRVVLNSSLAAADFTNANLERSCLRGSDMTGANFTEAKLSDSDLSECNLSEAVFYRARIIKAFLIKANLARANLRGANLREALVSKANIRGADFTGANLFRADFARIIGDRGTCFDGANMAEIRFVKRSDEQT